MQEFFLKLAQNINTYLSNYILIVLLVGIGLLYTIRTKFVQVRFFGEGLKRVFGGIKLNGGKQQGGISSFQALATAIAAQVGTGNIVGASGAILVGGPGAIFWMWIIAFLGMATIYAEAVLAQDSRITDANGDIIIKLVNVTDSERTVAIDIANAGVKSTATVYQVAGDDLGNDNILGAKEDCIMEEFTVDGIAEKFNYTVRQYSATVIRVSK